MQFSLPRGIPSGGAQKISDVVFATMMNTIESFPPRPRFHGMFASTCIKMHFLFQVLPHPSCKQVRRILKAYGFLSGRAIKKPLLSKVNRQKRLAFVDKFKGFDFTKTILSDEKIFRVRPGGVVRVWRLKGENRFLPKYLVSSEQKPQGLMVWAAMKTDGSICIRRCPPK